MCYIHVSISYDECKPIPQICTNKKKKLSVESGNYMIYYHIKSTVLIHGTQIIWGINKLKWKPKYINFLEIYEAMGYW